MIGDVVNLDDCVSVIIPVFNAEKYLEECIDSVINQTYNNLEIIIIDDGSTDSSGTICDNYANQDNRIKVIHRKNGGISDARNAGLKVIQGDYFTFVDADDTIDSNAIQLMVDSIRETGCMMAAFGYSTGTNGDIRDNGFFVLDSEELLGKILTNEENYTQIAVWGKLYCTKMFGDIRFSFGYIGCEDIEYTTQALTRIDKCVCSENVIYNYRIVDGSLSHMKKIFFPEIIQSRWHQYEMVRDRGWIDLSLKIKSDFYRQLLYFMSKEKDNRHRIMLSDYICNAKLSNTECKRLGGFRAVRAFIEKSFPKTAIILYSFRYKGDGIVLQWKD